MKDGERRDTVSKVLHARSDHAAIHRDLLVAPVKLELRTIPIGHPVTVLHAGAVNTHIGDHDLGSVEPPYEWAGQTDALCTSPLDL